MKMLRLYIMPVLFLVHLLFFFKRVYSAIKQELKGLPSEVKGKIRNLPSLKRSSFRVSLNITRVVFAVLQKSVVILLFIILAKFPKNLYIHLMYGYMIRIDHSFYE
jgi:hypothetical protein